MKNNLRIIENYSKITLKSSNIKAAEDFLQFFIKQRLNYV